MLEIPRFVVALGHVVWAVGFRVLASKVTPESWNMALGGLVLGSLVLYLKGMRVVIFQLSGFYYLVSR